MDTKCRLFETCKAPLCPLEDNTLRGEVWYGDGVWYGDEQICRNRKFQSLPWVKRQKRIAKLGLTIDEGFFTVRMLDAIEWIDKGLKGADSDAVKAEAKWQRQGCLRQGSE